MLRRSLRFYNSQSVTPSITCRADLHAYKKKAHALFMLRTTPQVALSAEAAIRLITADYCDGDNKSHTVHKIDSNVIPKEFRMSREEAKQFLRDCHEAGVVIVSPPPSSAEEKSATKKQQPNNKQIVITDPPAVYDAYRNKTVLDFIGTSQQYHESNLESNRLDYHKLLKPHNSTEKCSSSSTTTNAAGVNNTTNTSAIGCVLATDADEVAAAAVRAHSRFYAWLALGLSAQLLLFAYWTFIVYSWDVMEPFTYFVGCFYMILFFGYFVMTRRGQNFGEMDRVILQRVINGKIILKK